MRLRVRIGYSPLPELIRSNRDESLCIPLGQAAERRRASQAGLISISVMLSSNEENLIPKDSVCQSPGIWSPPPSSSLSIESETLQEKRTVFDEVGVVLGCCGNSFRDLSWGRELQWVRESSPLHHRERTLRMTNVTAW